MDRVVTAASLDLLDSDDFNEIQDNALGIAQVLGLMVGGDRLSGAGGASISISRIRALVIGTGVYSTSGETTVTLSGLSSNAWYYLYAYISSGSIAFELSTTVPDTALVFKNGDTSRRYCGCIYATAANAALPFRMCRGDYVYRSSIASGSTFRAITLGTASSFTDVDLTTWLPPHSRLANLSANIEYNSAGANLQIRTDGDTTHYEEIQMVSSDQQKIYRDFCIETSGAQLIEYRVTGGTGYAEIFVKGFRE